MGRVTLNMFTSVFYRVAAIFTGLAVQRYILSVYGSSVNGITSSIAQILSYLALIEAGIGAATVQSLHRPLNECDNEKASSLLSAGKLLYRRTGIIFFCVLAVISVVLPFFTMEELEPVTVAALTLISGLGNVISYLFIGKYSSLLIADSKNSVIYIWDSIYILLSSSVKIALMNAEASIILVQAVSPLCILLKLLGVALYVKKHYPSVNYRAEPDLSIKEKRNSAMTHQIVGMAVNHTDITILTLLSSLKTVSLYSVYYYIYSSIQGFMETVFNQTLIGSFGKAAASGKNGFSRRFTAFEAVYYLILYLIISIALSLTLPFIALYTRGVEDVEYINVSLAVLFAINSFLSLIRLPSILAVTVYGYFKETQKSAVAECVINLAVSLSLFPFIGIYGLLLGTMAAYLFRTQDSIRFIYRRCELSYKPFFRSHGTDLAASAIVLAVSHFFISPLTLSSWVEWLICAVLLTVFAASVFIALNLIFNRRRLTELLELIKK